MDQAALVREFRALHSELRSEGHNALESAHLLATALDPRSTGLRSGFVARVRAAVQNAPPDVAALAFQSFLSSDLRQALGQYLTPQPVAEHVARAIRDRLPRRARVLDPFAGTGVLLQAVAATRSDLRLSAQEINAIVASVGGAFLQLAKVDVRFEVRNTFADWPSSPSVEAVVTNPPFGARMPTSFLREQGIDVPKGLSRMNVVPVEILGLDWSVAAVVPGGLVAAVLPYSVMTNHNLKEYRRGLFERVELRALTVLPEATFGPFKGVAKACVLYLEKTGRPTTTTRVLQSKTIGYDETGRTTGQCDLPALEKSALAENLWQVVDGQLHRTSEPDLDGHVLGDFADVFRGKNPGRGVTADEGPALVKVGTLTGAYVPWKKATRVPESFYPAKDRWLRRGDICLTATAHKPRYIGMKVDYIDCVPSAGAVASGEVLVIRLRDDAPYPPAVLLRWLRSHEGYERLQALVRGSTAHLYPTDVLSLVVPRSVDSGDATRLQQQLTRMAAAYRVWEQMEAEFGLIHDQARRDDIDPQG